MPTASLSEAADAVCVDLTTRGEPVLRRYAETRHAAKSWDETANANNRRVVTRIEPTSLGFDVSFVCGSVPKQDHMPIWRKRLSWFKYTKFE